MSDALHRIGEVAAKAEVSTRTLRYYEELGLLSPAGHSPGGSRRYSDDDVARILRIRELQRMMAFDLEQIGDILHAEDRLDELRRDFRAGRAKGHERELILEAMAINARLRAQVREKLTVLRGFQRKLDVTAGRYRQFAVDRGIEPAPDPT
jgi:DNA-binding transcriptional MerR regulator